jgi:hypothetical protein
MTILKGKAERYFVCDFWAALFVFNEVDSIPWSFDRNLGCRMTKLTA